MQNEYVTKEEILQTMREYPSPVDDALSAYGAIEQLPAADVVPVMRCKDCKHYSPHPTDAEYGGKGWCRKLRGEAKQDFYCAAGAHEDGGETHAD